jgi:hypothetical protein
MKLEILHLPQDWHKRNLTKMRAFVGISISLSYFLLTGYTYSDTSTDEVSRKEAFRDVIGIVTPPFVSNIKSAWRSPADFYLRWFSFSYNDAFISQLRAIKGAKDVEFIRRPADHGPGDADNPNAPSWWRDAKVSAELEELRIERPIPGTNYGPYGPTDSACIWIDKEHRMAYALFLLQGLHY